MFRYAARCHVHRCLWNGKCNQKINFPHISSRHWFQSHWTSPWLTLLMSRSKSSQMSNEISAVNADRNAFALLRISMFISFRQYCFGSKWKNGFSFHFFLFQLVSLCSIVIQFAAIADRNMIIKDTKDPVTINLFSFIFAMGILVSFFKLMSDILVIYGAKKVSASRVACNMATIWSLAKKKKKTKQFIENCNCKHHSYRNEWIRRIICRFDRVVVYFLIPQQTTNEVSVWLIINLCSVLYSFVSMVFIYILFVEHDTTLDRKDVFVIELVLGIINGRWPSEQRILTNFAQLFLFSISQLHTFTCGIKCTCFRDNSIWMDELHSKVLYKVVPWPFKVKRKYRHERLQFNIRREMTPQFLCQTN